MKKALAAKARLDSVSKFPTQEKARRSLAGLFAASLVEVAGVEPASEGA